MRSMLTLRRFGWPLVFLFAALATPACGDGKAGPEELCEAYQECFDDPSVNGPNGDFYDQCIDALEQQLEAVDGTACEGPLEDMIDCLAENLTCEDFGQQACADEMNDFATCGGGNSQPGF